MSDRRSLFMPLELYIIYFSECFFPECLLILHRSDFPVSHPFLSAFVSLSTSSLSVSSLPLISCFFFLLPSSEDGLHTEWGGKWALRDARPARRSQTKKRAASWQLVSTCTAPLIEGISAGTLRYSFVHHWEMLMLSIWPGPLVNASFTHQSKLQVSL